VNMHFVGWALLVYGVVKGLEFLIGTLASTVFHNPTAAKMLGGGTFAN